ncbi:MAG: ATP-binding protein [Pseudomonadales bacterium]|jgi:two-component system sensor histidine kinase PhoQ|nr:ATP-binding protein [Pseudomonadales bacterium]MDP6316926.1 ATP-binding protein [Pseudomonadales bacterium]MDP7313886.1 ATP-binding protein [Pseudomonadales bacterium]|tara:strand:+ start:9037 stop:10416 length:1380 start_codon:yes stop_codon:yes gene_type:complete
MAGRNYSLRDRLLLTASLVLFTFLGLMGLVLDQAFQRSAEQGVSERLLIQIYGLLSVTEVENRELLLPEVLQEPRFNNPGSGLFALILDNTGSELWRSPSSVDLSLNSEETVGLHIGLEPGSDRLGRIEQSNQHQYFFLSYKILWLGVGDTSSEYTIVVVEAMDSYFGEIKSYRNNLWGWLVGVTVVLILIQGLVMKWGLSPLDDLAGDLKAIEDGRQDYLDGDYPAEIAGVTRNLNLLLSSERQQREKYRTTLADLAHSIKTPLAILKGTANQLVYEDADKASDIQETIDEQVARMDQIVGYQLQRAVTDSTQLIKKSILVQPIVVKLIETLKKVYREKNLEIEVNLQECTFFGDERDLMEVLGNIIDNACKYGRQHIRVEVGHQKDIDLVIVVEDDGNGISVKDRSRILNRGLRLDSQEAGQGIGLAIVIEIVERYGGTIEVGESLLGGASITIAFS